MGNTIVTSVKQAESGTHCRRRRHVLFPDHDLAQPLHHLGQVGLVGPAALLVPPVRGDADLAANGVIEDPGAPVFDQRINRAPEAANDRFTTPEDTPLILDVLANDTDPDGNALEFTTPVTWGLPDET